MAVKVVYDATRGLVQENDPSGVGGFQIKDVSLTEGTQSVTIADASGTASATGVSLVTTGGSEGAEKLLVNDGSATGQQKTVIYKAEGNGNDSLLVRDSGDTTTLATLDAVGDVVVLVWDSEVWRVVSLST